MKHVRGGRIRREWRRDIHILSGRRKRRNPHMLNRREFLTVLGASVALGEHGLEIRGQAAQPTEEWGAPAFELHFHMRGTAAANLAHLDGAGITAANLLTRATAGDQVSAAQTAAPGRFTWFASADPSRPEAIEALTQAVR